MAYKFKPPTSLTILDYIELESQRVVIEKGKLTGFKKLVAKLFGIKEAIEIQYGQTFKVMIAKIRHGRAYLLRLNTILRISDGTQFRTIEIDSSVKDVDFLSIQTLSYGPEIKVLSKDLMILGYTYTEGSNNGN